MLGNTAFAATPFADILQGTFLSSEVSEAASAASSQGTQMTFVGAMLEQIAAEGTPSKTLTIPVAVSEAVAGSGSSAALIVMDMQVNEANVFVDSPRSQADYVAQVAESAPLQDASTGVFIASPAIVEGAVVDAENSRRLLWENVDDNQNPSWTNIG